MFNQNRKKFISFFLFLFLKEILFTFLSLNISKCIDIVKKEILKTEKIYDEERVL